MNTEQVKALRAEMVRHGVGMRDMADVLGIKQTTLYRKLNRGVDFKVNEAEKIRKKLKLSDKLFLAIFFG